MSSNAKRFNKDKVDLSLLPIEASIQEARVWQMGEKKYGRNNWKKLWGDKTIDVAMASLLRHAFAILEGEVNDKESGIDHAAHIRCNAAMILEYRKLPKKEQSNDTLLLINIPEEQRISGGEIVQWTNKYIKGSELKGYKKRYGDDLTVVDSDEYFGVGMYYD